MISADLGPGSLAVASTECSRRRCVSRFGSLGWLSFSLIVALLRCSVCGQCTLSVGVPGPVHEVVEIEVLEWARGERATTIATIGAPAAVEVPEGDYGLRLAGTDYRFGPVRMRAGSAQRIELSAVTLTAPEGGFPTVFFVLDRESGAAAARISTQTEKPVPLLPGSFRLVRDLGELELEKELEPGIVWELALGALELRAPASVADHGYFVITTDAEARIAAYARWSQGPQHLFPGEYQVLREGSAVRSSPFSSRAGETTRLELSALRIVSLDDSSPVAPLTTVRPADGAVLVETSPDGLGHAIVPGSYQLESPEAAALADPALRKDFVTFRAAAGIATTFWVADGEILGGESGDLSVEVDALPRRTASFDRDHELRVRLAEPCKLEIRALAATGSAELASLESLEGIPPILVHPLRFPPEIPADTWFVVAVDAEFASGSKLEGRSAPLRLVRPRVDRVVGVEIAERGRTNITIVWKPAAGEPRGYRVYRVPSRGRPIHGDTLLAEPKFVDLGLSGAKAYRYQVVAVDARGLEGPPSQVIEGWTRTP
jgi:hypothetical protein